MGPPSWSLHLLSEVLSAFDVEDPDALRNVIHRVGESVDAEVVGLVGQDGLIDAIGLDARDAALLMASAGERAPLLQLTAGGTLHCQWSPLDGGEWLMAGRMAQGFDLEERSLLRAMARTISLSLQVLRSVSAERQARQDAERQATHDSLTGLPNRSQVIARLEHHLKGVGAGDPAGIAAVLFIDLDRFKIINDAHGHAMGDHLLVAIAARLRHLIRGEDLLGRLGGDEFVVISGHTDEAGIQLLAQRVIELLSQPLQVLGKPLLSGASVGIALFAPGETAESLLENADMAMYRAKQLGRGRHCFYDAAMRHDSQRRASLEADLHRALAAGQIECHLQPIVRLTQGYPVVGFEALARWRHPMHGLLSPAEFIPLAEESGLILPVDLQILQKACAHMAAWNRAGHTGLRLSVNISGRSLQDPSLVDRVEQILGSTGMMVDNLYLEITETVLVDEIEATGCTLARLNDIGLKLAVDDFGTGYSSLRYLKRFPVAILKIDRSFVDGLGCDREDETIVSAVLGLAGALGIAVVAEGVETAEQAAYLQKQGCGWGQGFQFGRPLPVEQAKLLLPRSAN